MRPFALALLLLLFPATASAEVVHYRGEETRVPASWPVYRLADHPRMCVRMDRDAVYLGRPSPRQRCPAHAVGRRRAILIDGREGAPARASTAGPPVKLAAASEYVGLGFDACTAPSKSTMSAWGSSPYRAIGVYIGGLNRGCSQSNLTSAWVREQVAAGWHLIPTYVGLQSPTSSCSSCAKLSTASAAAQGAEAASDAVSDAQAVGIGAGSPIYFDMESYTRTSSASGSTLAFLAAWTDALHAAGYGSGVYSSGASGIADLASKWGSSYSVPDDLWVADWNGAMSTDDPYVPDGAWSPHRRIHQFRGGHDETYGGVTINIDSDYVDGATVGSSPAPVPASTAPRGRLDSAGSPFPGQVRLTGWAYDPSLPAAPTVIQAYLGGPAGAPGARLYELGAVAGLPRPDVATVHRRAGPDHGFDVSFPVIGSRRNRVCVYAVAQESKLLGCRTVGIQVPLRISHLRSAGGRLRLGIDCVWPAGTECPGQILLRTRVATRRGAGRLVTVGIARRRFALAGGTSHRYAIPLNRRGRLLARLRGVMRAQLIVAIPGGRVTHSLTLR